MRNKCAYCQRRMGKFKCSMMLSPHCSSCCAGSCGKPNFIDETMASAQMMAGSCWPSADATRWALEALVLRVHSHLQSKKVSKKLLQDFGDVSGLIGIPPAAHGYKVKK